METTETFHPLETTVRKPRRFTFPFCYEPHELCRMAARELVAHVEGVPEWRREMQAGKMLGVLVVETADGRTGYLAAFSGLLMGRNDHPFFVPPVFDATPPNGHFKTEERQISALNDEIERLLRSDEYAAACRKADNAQAEARKHEDDYMKLMRLSKARRDALRRATGGIDAETAARLTRESQHQRAELRRLRRRNAEAVRLANLDKQALDDRVNSLKAERRRRSDALQQWLFSQYRMLNARGERRPLTEIFAETPRRTPPAGAGDCCAPKLLQYAYLNNMRPVSMAEFWFGASPVGEVRHHLHFYPACRGKCLPILSWMLQGLKVDPDPQLHGCTEPLEIVWEDESLVIVNKPAGMLSVRGRSERESVQSLLCERAGAGRQAYMVHRLDMDTSGLMVVAKTAETGRALQRQFSQHTVKKRYTALLDGTISHGRHGEITLPLSSDPLDRPFQKVDLANGKPALTTYRVLRQTLRGTLVSLVPLTGRTHQLRVHCASRLGLGAPIHGDRLYGRPAERLFLHATAIAFTHPVTGQRMKFERKAPFDT